MNKPTELVLEKLASELEEMDEIINAEQILTKIAFARRALNIVGEKNLQKTAAPISEAASFGEMGGTLAKALVAGVGLGLAGEAIGAGHKKVKELIFDSKLNSLAHEVKKVSPELSHAKPEEIKRMLRAGYVLAPDIMGNPTLAASFVNIGHSLGGKIDPNTMKLMAEAQSKSRDKNPSGLINSVDSVNSIIGKV